jgi:hypothetical protein
VLSALVALTGPVQIPLVFGEILKEAVADSERLEVYRAVAAELLEPDGRTLRVDKIASGALHAALAGDEHQAALWIGLILYVAVRKELSGEKLRALVERTRLIPSIARQKPRTAEIAFARLMMQARRRSLGR